jgi:HlyD family secretion protein
VKAGETVVAIIRPTVPEFLDARARREAEAAISAAEAMVEFARAQVREAEAQLAHAESEYARAAELRRRGAIAESRFEEIRVGVSTAEARLYSAEATLAVRQRELESARARLIGPETIAEDDPDACCILVRAPTTGQVLTVHHESEQVVSAGTPLVDLGDAERLEIVAELLSSDAVRIRPGAAARVDGWGGRALPATVRRVEPAGFTRVSALGIEEQRVRVVLDFDDPPDERAGLGHGYRVVVHVVVDRIEEAVLVPLGALFRRGAAWAVFVVAEDGRAVERTVQIGARTSQQAVVEAGLEPGDRVILHPRDRVTEGQPVAERQD